VLLTLSNLVAGVEYEVAVTDVGDVEGEPYGGVELVIADESGIAELQLTGLPSDHDFTVWVDGVWTTDPWEEPPFLGGGDFTPLETVFLTTAADFGLAPCPAPPVTPAGPSKPAALPATGAGDVSGLAATGLLLLAMGGAVLLSRRGVRRPE
jgi:LPXTG-motif cell wall-anchored protein